MAKINFRGQRVGGAGRPRTSQWKAAMLNWYYGGGGGSQLFVSNAGSGTGDGSSEANAMSLANYNNYTLLDNTRVIFL